jgi:hypothetical protein
LVHPVPNLERDGDWQEVPLWAWSAHNPKRGRVWVKPEGADRLSFRFDNGLGEVTIPVPFRGYGPDYVDLMTDRLRIRPRALTLTLFARLCLGDFFIHGIGGGKYDEVTDFIIRNYFGLEPPAYQVLSATLHLPLPGFPSTADDLHRAEHHRRDLDWNPQRHLTTQRADPTVKELIDVHELLVANEPPYADHPARRAWYRDLHAVTTRLRSFVAGQVPGAEATVARTRAEVSASAILQRRDYPWVLYPEEVLRPFLQSVLV